MPSLLLSAVSFTLILTTVFASVDHGSNPFPSNYSLKVLCIGDSITLGLMDHASTHIMNDTTWDGYRLDLYRLLSSQGLMPTFIGTQKDGTTDNPQPMHEGYGSKRILELQNLLQDNGILAEQPDIVLLHAGTNDLLWGDDSNNATTNRLMAPTRLGTLIDFVLEKSPHAAVFVAKLIPDKYHQPDTDTFNKQVPEIVKSRQDKGAKVVLVDMTVVNPTHEADGIHPDARGYQEMAMVWFEAIMSSPSAWWSFHFIEPCEEQDGTWLSRLGASFLCGIMSMLQKDWKRCARLTPRCQSTAI